MGLELKSKRVVRALFYLVEFAQVTFPAILDQRRGKGFQLGLWPLGFRFGCLEFYVLLRRMQVS